MGFCFKGTLTGAELTAKCAFDHAFGISSLSIVDEPVAEVSSGRPGYTSVSEVTDALELLLWLVLRQAVDADDANQPSARHGIRMRLVCLYERQPLQQAMGDSARVPGLDVGCIGHLLV